MDSELRQDIFGLDAFLNIVALIMILYKDDGHQPFMCFFLDPVHTIDSMVSSAAEANEAAVKHYTASSSMDIGRQDK
jgi:hypothetical protein